MSTLTKLPVAPLLKRLYASAAQDDPTILAQSRSVDVRDPDGGRSRAEVLSGIYMAVAPEVGRLLYALSRNRRARTIVEFGCSFGISTIHLAAALRDNDNRGRVVTTELSASKVQAAERNISEAGLSDIVEIREGDAFETLREGFDEGIDLVLLDGWKPLYLPMLELLESRLAAGALVIADDLNIGRSELAPYLSYVRDPQNGYVSAEVPLDDGLELSTRTNSHS
jgi:predicted O-methyltransferase YrrM